LQQTIHAKYQSYESVQYSKYMPVLQDSQYSTRSRTVCQRRGTRIFGLERRSIWTPNEACHTPSKL
jgi:hypothetical protein